MSCRVLIASVLQEFGPTGVQTYARTVRDYLRARGCQAQLVTPLSRWSPLGAGIFALRRVMGQRGGRPSLWWYRWSHYMFVRFALQRALNASDQPVTVYAQCPLSARAALDARQDRACRVVMVVHFNISAAEEAVMQGYGRRGDWLYRTIRRFESTTLPRLDGIVYVSSFMQRIVQAEVPGVSRVSSIVVPSFVQAPDASGAGGFARDLINIGVLEPRKNQAYLLKVLAHTRRQGKCYSLTLVGDGPDRHKLEHLAQSLGVAPQVSFLGFQRDAARLLSQHRAYAHSAIMENLPIAVIEALAAGLPVVAAPVGGIPELFTDEVEGSYWPLDDPAEGARRIISLLDDPARYVSNAVAARRRFAERFAPEVAGDPLLAFLCLGA
jgi:glycosyltransferase involved in cell wall biosynthesis